MTSTAQSSPFSGILGILQMFFRAMVGAYGLNIILHTLAILIIGERWIVIEFLNTFAHLLWIPTIIIIPICLLLREWRLSLMLLPGFIGFILIWGGMFVPNATVTTSDDDLILTIMSYNLFAANEAPDLYVEAIRDASADIVALQELNFRQVDTLTNEFATEYPYQSFHTGYGTEGQGIMSKYPIEDDTYWRYDFLRAALGHQRTEIAITDDETIVIYNVHPSHPGMQGQLYNPEWRSMEIADIIERSTRETLPVLLMGDFNMPDFSEDYSALRAYYNDSFRTAGFGMGWTFPVAESIFPVFLRLDYIFYSNSFIPTRAEVQTRFTGSDHYALLADFIVIIDSD